MLSAKLAGYETALTSVLKEVKKTRAEDRKRKRCMTFLMPPPLDNYLGGGVGVSNNLPRGVGGIIFDWKHMKIVLKLECSFRP